MTSDQPLFLYIRKWDEQSTQRFILKDNKIINDGIINNYIVIIIDTYNYVN